MTKKLKPVLLENHEQPRIWQINITTSNNQWARMEFSDKTTADSEYLRIRSQGIFGGSWIRNIVLESVAHVTPQ